MTTAMKWAMIGYPLPRRSTRHIRHRPSQVLRIIHHRNEDGVCAVGSEWSLVIDDDDDDEERPCEEMLCVHYNCPKLNRPVRQV